MLQLKARTISQKFVHVRYDVHHFGMFMLAVKTAKSVTCGLFGNAGNADTTALTSRSDHNDMNSSN